MRSIICLLVIICILCLNNYVSCGWTSIGNGIAESVVGNTQCHYLVAFGGFKSLVSDSQIWVTQLNSGFFGGKMSNLVAVKGPADPGYRGKEIANSKLVSAISSSSNQCHSPAMIVVAHSSGTYVASEFLSGFASNSGLFNKFHGRVIYYDLDGGPGVSGQAKKLLQHQYMVSSVGSRNYDFSRGQGKQAGNQFLLLDNSHSGCSSAWCKHMVCITTHPHNPASWSTLDVHGIDAQHPVQVGYFQQTSSILSGLLGNGQGNEADLDDVENIVNPASQHMVEGPEKDPNTIILPPHVHVAIEL